MDTPAIEALDPERCSQRDWEACYALNLAAHGESGTFPMSLTAYRAGHLAPDDGLQHRHFVARAASEVVGKADLTTKPDEPTLAGLALHVGAGYRRRGIARALVGHVLLTPAAREFETLWCGTMHPVGREVCERFGGEVALTGAQRYLALDAVDWAAVERMRAKGKRRFADTRLLEMERLPDELAGAFLATHNRAWADQPRPSDRPEDAFTLEDRRAAEHSCALRGWQWLTLVSQERDGAISGLTETRYDPSTPQLVRQHFTGVAPEHRRRGLATWLKAEMLARVRERYPAAVRVMTNNADDNAPMLAINRALGFGDAIEHQTYRFHVPDLRTRLGL